MAHVHIIGAGLAGLAAGVKLVDAGREVTLYESAPTAGGRCKSFPDPVLGRVIDNGNHLVLGANRDLLRLLGRIGVQLHFMRSSAPLPRYDIQTGIKELFRRRRALLSYAWLLSADKSQTVAACFSARSALFQEFVAPFCLAALNTPPEAASAYALRTLLGRLIRSGPRGFDRVLPRADWSACLITPALHHITARGGRFHAPKRLEGWEWRDGRVTQLRFAREAPVPVDSNDRVILAVPPWEAARLLPSMVFPQAFHAIVNGHFLHAASSGHEILGVTHGTAQWIFLKDGMISTTTSAADALLVLPQAALAQALWRDVCRALAICDPLPAYRIVTEKRATFAMAPNAIYPPARQYGNVTLAGDYTQTPLPATLDMAVRSGFQAAAWVMRA